jgi:hypothetical protein
MDDLVNLETQFWTAIKERDAEALARLTDDECIVTEARPAFHRQGGTALGDGEAKIS